MAELIKMSCIIGKRLNDTLNFKKRTNASEIVCDDDFELQFLPLVINTHNLTICIYDIQCII